MNGILPYIFLDTVVNSLCFVVTLTQCLHWVHFLFYFEYAFWYSLLNSIWTLFIKSERIVYTRCTVFGYILEIPIKVNCCYFWWSSSPLGKDWTNGEENRLIVIPFILWLVDLLARFRFLTVSLKHEVKFYRCLHFYAKLI